MGKKSKRKAEKVRELADGMHRVAEPRVTILRGGPDSEAVGRRIADAIDAEFQLISPVATAPARWEIDTFNGRTGIHDNATDLWAFVGDEDEDEMLASLNDLGAISLYVWSHGPSEAVMAVNHLTIDNRFWLAEHPDAGRAMFDRHTNLFHPLDGMGVEEAASFMEGFEKFPAASISDCEEEAKISGDQQHWMSWREWIIDNGTVGFNEPAEEPDETPQEPVSPHSNTEVPMHQVLVISSASWAHTTMVSQLLQAYWNRVGNPPLMLVTSDSTFGAEGAARQLAAAVDGVEHVAVGDLDIVGMRLDYGFAFITNESPDAEFALQLALKSGVPMHVIRETSAVVPANAWAKR